MQPWKTSHPLQTQTLIRTTAALVIHLHRALNPSPAPAVVALVVMVGEGLPGLQNIVGSTAGLEASALIDLRGTMAEVGFLLEETTAAVVRLQNDDLVLLLGPTALCRAEVLHRGEGTNLLREGRVLLSRIHDVVVAQNHGPHHRLLGRNVIGMVATSVLGTAARGIFRPVHLLLGAGTWTSLLRGEKGALQGTDETAR